MKKLFSLEHSLELLASVIALAALLGVFQTFIIGKHFVIPTMVMFLAIFFGNLARSGLRGERWAQQLLFWMFFLATCHTFFALFWAADARPGQALGAAFYPAYGSFFVVVGFLSWQYARKNRLLR